MRYFSSAWISDANAPMSNQRIACHRSSTMALVFRRLTEKIPHITHTLLILACAFAFSSAAQAGNVANGSLLFNTTFACTGCHDSPPNKPQLNAANASNSTVLNYAIANNFGSAMGVYQSTTVDGVNGATPLTATQRADITAYLDSLVTTPTVAVAYHGATAAIPLKLTHDDAPISVFTSIAYSSQVNGTVATGTDVTSNSLAAGYPLKEYTAVYTHTANNCSAGSFVATATGPGGTSSARSVNITVTPPTAPNISTSATTSSPAYNTATAIPITSSGGTISSITVTSGLSNGGSLVTNGTTSFTYTSNSAAYSASDSFTYRANGPCANSATVTVNISIAAPPTPVINSVLTANGATGVAFAGYQITASNLPTSFSASGLPPGLSIDASGYISGTPTANGTFNSSIMATNSSGTDTDTLVFTIALSAPAITSTLTANGATGVAFAYQIVATNSPTSYNATGLPSGLSINTSTGAISGTPTADGISNVSISATNATATDTETLVINISLTAPAITSGLTASGSTGVVFGGYTIVATNSPTSYNATSLPPGLNINTTTGAITGIPTANGTYNTSISATNATATDTQTLVFTIALSAPSITSTLTASGATSVAFGGYTIVATNSPTSYNATSLPPGLNINTSTGAISGTPTLNGTFNTTITATNATATDSKTLVFTISLTAPSITSANTASGTYGIAFNYQITASNLPTSYAASGLPTGVTVDTSTGLISGTPTAGGTYNATVSATNATATANLAVTMTIAFTAPTTAAVSTTVPFNTATAVNLTVGGQYTQVNIASAPSNGTAPTPAAGVTTVTYTPTAGYTGSDSFTYTATGPGGTSSAATVTITVSTLVPTAGSTTLAVTMNTATALDLAPFITGSSISGVSVSAQPSHGVATVNGTIVTYTPTTNYLGADSFSYLAYGNGGTSPAPGVITVTVSGRPDPTQDAAVTGLISAQVDTARRFSRAQISNFQGRLESLHRSRSNTESDDSGSASSGSSFNAKADTLRTAITGKALNNHNATQRRSNATPSRPTGAAYQPAATLPSVSSDPMGRDFPGAQTAQTNPLMTVVAALSAAGNASQSGQAANLGNALTTAVAAIQSSSLNLASSTGNADGSSALPGGVDYWIGGGVRFGKRGQTGTSNELNFTTDGISVGIDKRLSDRVAVGGGIGYGRDQTNIGTDGSNSKAHSATIAVYGSYQPTPETFIDGVIGYGEMRYQNDRYVAAATDFARAERSGDQIFASLTSGYEHQSEGLLLSPYGRLDLARNRLAQSTETGAGIFALTYASQSIPSVAFSVGLRAETAHAMDFGWAKPRMRVEFQHDFKGEQQASVSYADLPGTSYTIAATPTKRNSFVLGLGSDFIMYNGLTLSFDYQLQRSSTDDSSQALMFKLTKELDGRSPSDLLLSSSGFLSKYRIRGNAGYLYDDNINRSSTATESLSDRAYSVGFNKTWFTPVTDNSRVLVNGFVGGEKFRTYSGLDRLFLGAHGEYQYRASGEFGTPIWAIFGDVSSEAFSSRLRDGYRYALGVSVRKPLTDRINLFGALARNLRNGSSDVFDTIDNSAKLDLEYTWPNNSTLYLNTEYRHGDLISSGSHTLQNIDIAKVFTRDDVFTSNSFYAYRFDGKTVLYTLGYNLPLGTKDSLDFSWRRVHSAASILPTISSWSAKRYVDNQFSILYLFSF